MSCLPFVCGNDVDTLKIEVEIEVRRSNDPLGLGLSSIETFKANLTLNIDIKEKVTFNWLKKEAILQFNIENPQVKIPYVQGICDKINNARPVLIDHDVIVSDYCSEFVEKKKKDFQFELLTGGGINNLSDEILLLILTYLGLSMRQLAGLRTISARFSRVFGSDEAWINAQDQIEREYQLYTDGLNVGYSNELQQVAIWLSEESILPRFAAARVRWISLKNSRLSVFLGSIPKLTTSLESMYHASLRWLSPFALPPRHCQRNCVFVCGQSYVSALILETLALLLPESSITGSRYRGPVLPGYSEVSSTSRGGAIRHEIPSDRLYEYHSAPPSQQNKLVSRVGYHSLGDDRLVFMRQDSDSHDAILTRPRTLGLIFALDCELYSRQVISGLPLLSFDARSMTEDIQQTLLALPETRAQELRLRAELTRLWRSYASALLQSIHAHKGYDNNNSNSHSPCGMRARLHLLHDSALLAPFEVARPLLVLLRLTDMGGLVEPSHHRPSITKNTLQQSSSNRSNRSNSSNSSNSSNNDSNTAHLIGSQPQIQSLHNPVPVTEVLTPSTTSETLPSVADDDEFQPKQVYDAHWGQQFVRKEIAKLEEEKKHQMKQRQLLLARQICCVFWTRRVRGLLLDIMGASSDVTENRRRWHVQAVNGDALDSLRRQKWTTQLKTKETLAYSGFTGGVNALIRAVSANNTRGSV